MQVEHTRSNFEQYLAEAKTVTKKFIQIEIDTMSYQDIPEAVKLFASVWQEGDATSLFDFYQQVSDMIPEKISQKFQDKILERIKDGEGEDKRAAMDTFIIINLPTILPLLRPLSKDAQDNDDKLQAAFAGCLADSFEINYAIKQRVHLIVLKAMRNYEAQQSDLNDHEHWPGFVPVDNPDDPAKEYEKNNTVQRIKETLSILTEREFEFLNLHYPSDESQKSKTYEEIGTMFGLTRERVRQIISKALRKLRSKNLLPSAPATL